MAEYSYVLGHHLVYLTLPPWLTVGDILSGRLEQIKAGELKGTNQFLEILLVLFCAIGIPI